MEKEAFLALIEKYLQGKASGAEEQLLFRYYDALQAPDAHEDRLLMRDEDQIRRHLFARISDQLSSRPATTINQQLVPPVVRQLYPALWRYVAAVILVSSLIWAYLAVKQAGPDAAVSGPGLIPKPASYATGEDRAILTLATGQKISLHQRPNGLVANQGTTRIEKTADGQLAYRAGKSVTRHVPTYNTLSTPKGAQYRLTLPDGSTVWLNAASSIRFPVVFDPRQRCVELDGEAYFDIAPLRVASASASGSQAANQRVPFVVQSGNQRLEVLGTRFNVNAYTDEPRLKTTLLEGSLRVSHTHRGDGRLLKPGQQAQLGPGIDSPIRVVAADGQSVIAWKAGYFAFTDESLASMMRKLARWYNVQVVIDPALINQQFTATISRRESLSNVLSMLQLTGALHFTIDTTATTPRVTTVTVTP